jgi:hypothetical protein
MWVADAQTFKQPKALASGGNDFPQNALALIYPDKVIALRFGASFNPLHIGSVLVWNIANDYPMYDSALRTRPPQPSPLRSRRLAVR